MSFFYVITKFINFTRHPLPYPIEESNKKNAVRDVFVLFILKLLIIISWHYFILKPLCIRFGVRSNIHLAFVYRHPILRIVMTCLVAPIFEELIYRYFMKFKPIFIFIFQTFIIWWVIYYPVKHFSTFSESNLQFIRILLFVVITATQIIIYFNLKENNGTESYFRRNFTMMYYVSILSFACQHVSNFNLNGNFWLVPLIILPFAISGAIYSYSKMKYGMWSNVGMHMGNNLLFTVIIPSII
jgi:hypothetical protein